MTDNHLAQIGAHQKHVQQVVMYYIPQNAVGYNSFFML